MKRTQLMKFFLTSVTSIGVATFVGIGSASASGCTPDITPTVTQSGSVLSVCGTDSADVIQFTETGAGFTVNANGTGYGPYYGVTSLVAWGNAGNDNIAVTSYTATTATCTFDGGDGNDYLSGASGNDTLTGGAGSETMYGRAGNDNLSGGDDGEIAMYGDDGDDVMSGGNGNDTMYGGAGNDIMRGDAGTDTLSANSGNDALLGGPDADMINGGTNASLLWGGAGADRLNGAGGDMMVAGTTDHDATDADLTALVNEWKLVNSTNKATIRGEILSGNLTTSGGGSIGSLNVANDLATDLLTGSATSGRIDWFLYSPGGTGADRISRNGTEDMLN